MRLETFDLLFNLAIGITVFISVAIFTDVIWRRLAKPGAKTKFERFLSRLAVSLFFVGLVILSFLIISITAPTTV
jgi:hypothetical protein